MSSDASAEGTPTPAPAAPPFGADEQIAFLRERGVEVELAEEREAKAAARAASAAALSAAAARPNAPTFSYVRIPADAHASVEELKAALPTGEAATAGLPAGDVLPTPMTAKPYLSAAVFTVPLIVPSP